MKIGISMFVTYVSWQTTTHTYIFENLKANCFGIGKKNQSSIFNEVNGYLLRGMEKCIFI